MKINPEQRAKQAAQAIATIRLNRKSFSYQGMIELLKNQKCPYPNRIPTVLIERNLLKKEGKEYVFTHDTPVYYGELRVALDDLSRINTSANKQSIRKKRIVTTTEQNINKFPASWQEVDAQLLIEHIKKLGYDVRKINITYTPC